MAPTFGLLFSRNVQIEKNQWRRIVLETSITLVLLLVVLLNLIDMPTSWLDSSSWPSDDDIASHSLDNLNIITGLMNTKRDRTKYVLNYAPITEFTTEVAKSVAKTLDLNDTIGFETMEKLQNQFDDRTTLAGIVFSGLKGDQVPKELNVAIRFPSEFRTINPFLTQDRLWVTRCSGVVHPKHDATHDNNIHQDIYIREGFLQIQHQVFMEWYHKLRREQPTAYTEPHVQVHNIRVLGSDALCSTLGVSSVPDFLYNFLYLLPFLNIVRNIAQQLNDNVMVHQWQYGYSFSKQWLAAFLPLFLRLIVLGFIIVLMIFFLWIFLSGAQMAMQALALMIVFIILYTIGLVLTAFVYAKAFANSLNAVLFSIIVWIFNYCVFCIILQRYWDVHGLYVIFIMTVFFNNQMEFAIQMFYRLTDKSGDVQGNDYWILFGSILLCLVVHILVLFIIQWRWPGSLISRRVVSQKMPKQKSKNEKRKRNPMFSRVRKFYNYEYGDVGSVEMLRLHAISTTTHADTERKVLKSISLRTYKGEIFVVLGHLGSGKLTLLRVMSGLKYPLNGNIYINGVEAPPGKKRKRLIDFRFKEDGLADYLTVEETLKYHAKLKLSDDDQDRVPLECNKFLGYLNEYISNRRTLAKNLNTGQRRLLSLCCALSGSTPVLILEDPTKNLNAFYTQAFWTIANLEKDDRAIVVGTYSVDEADRIADRIGVLNMGFLEASGTPFFLRNHFSSALELIVIKNPNVPEGPITEFLQRFIPDIKPENEIGDSLTYKIDHIHRFTLQRVLIHLENDRKMLGIENARVLGSDLSTIFMKLVTSFRLQQQMIPDVTQFLKYHVVSNKRLRRQQMRAMFYKKMIHAAPNFWPICVIVLCSMVIVILAWLAVSLDVPEKRTNSIHIGFQKSQDSMSNIPNLKDCGYIDIRTVAKVKKYKKTNAVSRTFVENSFVCKSGSYKADLKKKNSDRKSMGAVEADGPQKLNGFINQDTFHSAPMTLNLLHNIILKQSYPTLKNIGCQLDNHPMPTPLSLKINLLDNEISHISAPIAIGAILPMAISTFILPLVEERGTQMRELQINAGIGLQIYWGINLIWDLITFFIYSILIIFIVSLSGIGNFNFTDNLVILLLFVCFGFSGLPITYVVSMYNTLVLRGYLCSVLLHSLTGIFLYILYWDVANSNVIYFYFASLFPGFAMLDAISNIFTQGVERQLCDTRCAEIANCTAQNMHEMVPRCQFGTYFKWEQPGILPAMTCMLIVGLLILALIFWIELHRHERQYTTTRDIRNFRTLSYPFDDADVADVKIKIAAADPSKCKQSVFLVDQVEAELPKEGKYVKTVSFALNKYMMMVIYAPRNSGKSHLIRQLAGIDRFAFGEIYVRGFEHKYDIEKIRDYVGYCPQSKGLLTDLTPREHIRLFYMIRGVPETQIASKMHDICLMLNMTGWMHRKVNTLTPEKQRKLNVALALVAYNKVFILDEPTYGMPATTKREIWNILRYLRYCGRTIICATNEEIECKMLGDFIMLYQDGEMLSLGSTQYLRYKFSHGFYMEVRLIRDGATEEESEENLRKDVNNLIRFVTFLHEKSELVGQMNNWFKFYLPIKNIVYSFLYGAMEKNKVRLNIMDYFIYQASLNNILMQLQATRNQLKQNYRQGSDGFWYPNQK